jgi:fermentation-respiration switch protein FrsA (DUF1100 family)
MILRRLTDSMLFYPARGQWRTPTSVGLSYEEVWLDAEGDRIQSWWVEGRPSRPVVMMFHGNAGTIADRLENVRQIVDRLGATVFQIEYPGYGDSGGRPSESSLYASGEAGLKEARRRVGQRKLVVFGRSLGGAVAIELASRHVVEGLVVESTFTSLPDLAPATGLPLARYLAAYRFDSLAKIKDVHAPLLIIHGDRDELVSFSMGQRLLEAATGALARRLHTVEGGTHNDTWFVGGEAYWRAWGDFLAGLGQTL